MRHYHNSVLGPDFFLLFLLLFTVNNLYTFKYVYMEDISHVQMLNNYLVQLEKYYSKSSNYPEHPQVLEKQKYLWQLRD